MNTQDKNTQTQKTGNGADDNVANFGMSGGGSSSSLGSTGAGNTGNPGTGGTTGSGLGSNIGSALGTNQPEPQRHSEGVIARTIEEQTAKLPSDTFLWAAVGAMAASAIFEFSGAKDKSRFVGQWVAPFLLFGVYNKLVKTQGSDRVH
ncbi:MAG: hypothetical protein ABR530_01055 [Pyrinomonadaceae bacterium]